MAYTDTQLYISHSLDQSNDDLFSCEGKQNDQRLLQNLVELDYICFTNGSLQMTKSGYDYFMRKCNVENDVFQFDRFAPGDIQQAIYQQFFAGKPKMNTVEKFIKINL